MLVQLCFFVVLLLSADGEAAKQHDHHGDRLRHEHHHQAHSHVSSCTKSSRLPGFSGGKYGNPGMMVVLPEKGIQTFLDSGVQAAAATVKNATVPNVAVTVAGAKVLLYDIYIHHVNPGSYGYQLKDPNVVNVSFSSASIELKGKWNYVESGKDGYNVSGVFTAVTQNVTGFCTFALTKTAAGAPQLSNVRCSVTILNDFNVEAHTNGNSSSGDVVSRKMMERNLQYLLPLNTIVRNALKDYLTHTFSAYVSSFHTQQKVGPEEASLTLNTGLLSNPKFGKNEIRLPLKGQFNNLPLGYYPGNLHSCGMNNTCVNLLVSEYVFNALSSYSFSHKVLKQFNLNASDDTPSLTVTTVSAPVITIERKDCKWLAGGSYKNSHSVPFKNRTCGTFESTAPCELKINGTQFHLEIDNVQTNVTDKCLEKASKLADVLSNTLKQATNDFMRAYNLTIPQADFEKLSVNKYVFCNKTVAIAYTIDSI